MDGIAADNDLPRRIYYKEIDVRFTPPFTLSLRKILFVSGIFRSECNGWIMLIRLPLVCSYGEAEPL